MLKESPRTLLRASPDIVLIRDMAWEEALRGEEAGDDEHLVLFAHLWILALALLEPDPTERAILISQIPDTPGDALAAMHG